MAYNILDAECSVVQENTQDSAEFVHSVHKTI